MWLKDHPLFAEIVNYVSEGVILLRLDSKERPLSVIMVNDVICRQTGYDQDEMLGLTRQEMAAIGLTGPDLESGVWVPDQGGKYCDWTLLHKRGSSVQVHLYRKRIEWKTQKVALIITHDLTERRRIENTLNERERRYQQMIKLSPEPIIFHSEEIIIYSNDAALRLFGVEQESELLGKSLIDYIHPDYHERVREQINAFHSNEDPFQYIEYPMLRKDGEWIEIEASSTGVFQYSEHPIFQSVLRNITDRKRRERLLRQSDKLSAVGQLAAGIAHEIRNPLTALKGFVQLLKSKSADNHHYFDIMLSELERINYIVGEFILIAKPPQDKEFEYRSAANMIADIVTVLDSQAILNNVEICGHFPDDLPMVLCDEHQLKQVFVNLVKNAIEAMPEGGLLLITGESEEGFIRLRFSDSGKGIEKDQLPRIGEPFYTTKEKGSGLGLMICNQIIENHKGRLRIESSPGLGTTVEIELPV
ncbi:hypothetical protein J2TS4_04100 [Paenibacillus sp. J2TS4]|nr:hypothetical protein J2TS4_04100 [Paenibacillus sp. J2TS4]